MAASVSLLSGERYPGATASCGKGEAMLQHSPALLSWVTQSKVLNKRVAAQCRARAALQTLTAHLPLPLHSALPFTRGPPPPCLALVRSLGWLRRRRETNSVSTHSPFLKTLDQKEVRILLCTQRLPGAYFQAVLCNQGNENPTFSAEADALPDFQEKNKPNKDLRTVASSSSF